MTDDEHYVTGEPYNLQVRASAPVVVHSPKVAKTVGNIANTVVDHVYAILPELAEMTDPAVRNVVVTGSNVWKYLYGEVPDPQSDIDIVYLVPETSDISAVNCAVVTEPLLRCLGLEYELGTPTYPVKLVVLPGRRYITADGRTVDIWVFPGTVEQALLNYPSESHAHCRAGFTITQGLTVLPNERAE